MAICEAGKQAQNALSSLPGGNSLLDMGLPCSSSESSLAPDKEISYARLTLCCCMEAFLENIFPLLIDIITECSRIVCSGAFIENGLWTFGLIQPGGTYSFKQG